MLTTETLVAAVASSDKWLSPSGISCYYVPLNQYWGVKVYRKKDERDYAVDQQRKIFNIGYAPAVGSVFDVGTSYCYVTQAATVVIDTTTELEWSEKCQATRVKYPNIDMEIDILYKQLNPYMNFVDCHYGHVGYLNGFLVAIDFGY